MTKSSAIAPPVMLLTAFAIGGASAQPVESDRTVTTAQYEQWKADLDQLGAVGRRRRDRRP